ncbi:MAG TPA: EAL domain-containing protein [Longimicrobium sp.]|nr:EAL domain-containing protein [Longimicrobium sp.]
MVPRPSLHVPSTHSASGTAPDESFERLAALAGRLLGAPVAVVSLVDAERPFATGGNGGWRARREAPLARSLCRVAVEGGQPLALRDAREHPALRDDPGLWLGEVGYLGVPFRYADGRVAGNLCVADVKPRDWTPDEVQTLSGLADFGALLADARRERPGLEEALALAARTVRKAVPLRMLKKAVETMQLGVTITDTHGRILYSNPADARMHGYSAEELVGKHARLFAPAEHARPLAPERLEQVSSWSRETVNLRKNGTLFPVLLRSDVVHDRAGRPIGFVTCCEDLTQRKQLERELLRNAFYDPVTGFPNRGLLQHRMELALDRARRENHRFAVLAVELDRIQLVNEGLGRAAGEELLSAAAHRLRDCVGAETLVAHVAPDQYAILLEEVGGIGEATRVAECVRRSMGEPFRLSGREVFTGASIGVVLSGASYERADDVLRDAGIAMVRAREAADGQYHLFDPAMHAEAMARLHLETDLRRALERGELRVYYQPIVDLQTGRIAGFEALARWQHPERGLILPDDFIPLAEDTGLILPLGMWVLEEACRAIRRWQGLPGHERLKMAVNLSPRQFHQADLVQRVEQVLRDTGVPAGTLELEITESTILQHTNGVFDTLQRLKDLGVRLHVDDFGTGYSSLSYLHRLPLDALKIDRSFVLGEGNGSLQLVRTIVAMAHALGVKVVTEGVETAELLGELRALDCEYGQGFFFSRPVDAAEIERLFVENPSW